MNPRRRRLIAIATLQKAAKEEKNTHSKTEEQVIIETPVVEKKKGAPMDSFIAKELEEIERIPSDKKKTKTTKKKTKTTKKKTGGK